MEGDLAKWVQLDAPSCDTRYDAISAGAVSEGAARFYAGVTVGKFKLCYKFNYFAPDGSKCTYCYGAHCFRRRCNLLTPTPYLMYDDVLLSVISYESVLPRGTAIGCESDVVIRGRGFLQLGEALTPLAEMTCGFTNPEREYYTVVVHNDTITKWRLAPPVSTPATVINDTAISCRTTAPSTKGDFALRVDFGGLTAQHGNAFPTFRAFDFEDSQVSVVAPAAGSYVKVVDLALQGLFEDFGTPACRIGSWFSTYTIVVNSSYVLCDKPIFPASERAVAGQYPLLFTPNRQCVRGATAPYTGLSNFTGEGSAFRTYNPQCNALTSYGGEDVPQTDPVRIIGIGFLYPGLPYGFCRYSRLIDGVVNPVNSTIIETPVTALSQTELECKAPTTRGLGGGLGKWLVEVLENGRDINPVQGEDLIYEVWATETVSYLTVSPQGIPVGEPSSLTVHGTGFADFGYGQLQCVYSRDFANFFATRQAFQGQLIDSTRILCPPPPDELIDTRGVVLLRASLAGSDDELRLMRIPQLGVPVYVNVNITSISPSSGDALGGTPVTFYGIGFRAGIALDRMRCMFGVNVLPAPPVEINASSVTCIAPPGAERPGGTPVKVALNGFSFDTARALSFYYVGLSPPRLATVFFATDGSRLFARFDGPDTNRAGMIGDDDCDLIFDDETSRRLRGSGDVPVRCGWEDDTTVIAFLTSFTNASIDMRVGSRPNVIWPREWAYPGRCDLPGSMCALETSIAINSAFPCDDGFTTRREECEKPVALVQAPSTLSSCSEGTSLTLDGSISTGGGIKALQFDWRALPAECDNYVPIRERLLSLGDVQRVTLRPLEELAGGSTYAFRLVVTSFLGLSSEAYLMTIQRAENPVPTVTILSPPLLHAKPGFTVSLVCEAIIASCFETDSAIGRGVTFQWIADSTTPLALDPISSKRRSLMVRAPPDAPGPPPRAAASCASPAPQPRPPRSSPARPPEAPLRSVGAAPDQWTTAAFGA